MDYREGLTLYPAESPEAAPVRISPVFGGLVGATVLAGYLTYRGEWATVPRTVFFVLFVIGGWMITLALHEFGHALAAYWGGDTGVVHRGYLTLNPFKYTHATYSILLPLLYLAMGGIGLPGGAVYINHAAIRSRRKRALAAAAGPAGTGACALLLLLPFILGIANAGKFQHREFWSALALLAFLQITGFFFNLLPLPGFDGWGIIEILLPESAARRARAMTGYTFILIFVLFMNDTFVSRGFWQWIFLVCRQVNLDLTLIRDGLRMFQFWSG